MATRAERSRRARKPSETEVARSKSSAGEAAALRAASPSIHEAIAAAPGGRVDYGPDGRIVGYAPPRHEDGEKRRRQNEAVYEAFQPRRRLEVAVGGERNARRRTVRMRNTKTGAVQEVPEEAARRPHLVEPMMRVKSNPNVVFSFLAFNDPHQRWWRAEQRGSECSWVARVGGPHGDTVATGVTDSLVAAKDAAEAALRSLQLPELEPLAGGPAVFVH